jgi:hypothetical protein
MPNGSISYLIRIEEALEEGSIWCLTSENLPGLLLGGPDLPALRADLPEAIRLLFLHNYQMEVEVRLVSSEPPMPGRAEQPKLNPKLWTAVPHLRAA